MMNAGRAFFGTDRFDFELVKFDGSATREYHRFTDVVRDTIDVRVWQGLHFRTADVQGAGIGAQVADWVYRSGC
jgi:hypothetical protein